MTSLCVSLIETVYFDPEHSPSLMQMLLGLALRPVLYERRMFWGFRSRWMMPLLLKTLMAPANCCSNTRIVSSLREPLAMKKKLYSLIMTYLIVIYIYIIELWDITSLFTKRYQSIKNKMSSYHPPPKAHAPLLPVYLFPFTQNMLVSCSLIFSPHVFPLQERADNRLPGEWGQPLVWVSAGDLGVVPVSLW